MTAKLFEAILWGFSCGICGVVYKEILAKEEAFNWWWRWGIRFERRWFWKPIWGCSFCNAGQITLWTYLTAQIWRLAHSVGISFKSVSTALFGLLIAVSFAIFTAKTISFYFQKHEI